MLLHYDAVATFKRLFYKDLLTVEHQSTGEIKLDKIHYTNGAIDEEANFWGYTFEKNGKKYLIPSQVNGKDLGVLKKLPIYIKNPEKVAHRGVVYWLVKEIVPARPKPDKKMTFRQLVNKMASFKHTNHIHQKLWWFMAFTQMLDRANFRVSTPAGFGKDSVVDIFRDLIGGSATIESPTLAKLEFMSTYKWLAVNEVLDISKAEWKIIEQFLLTTGAFKSEVTKHSRATSGVKESLDINQLSLSLLYNDIDHYSDPEKYFDLIAKEALIDRFPAFRLCGTYAEDFNQIKNVDVEQFVAEHFQEYRDLISTIAYYRENLHSETKDFNTDKFKDLPERWKTNINKLLAVISLYCDDQEDFDSWAEIILKSLKDYQDMLDYPKALSKAMERLSQSKMSLIMKQVQAEPYYTGKVQLLNSAKAVDTIQDKKGFW